MNHKLRFILKTASDLSDESNSNWTGDVNDFVTASAGSLDETRDEYLTTFDVEYFRQALEDNEVPDVDWIYLDSADTNLIIIEPSKKDELFS